MRRASRAPCSGWKRKWHMPHETRMQQEQRHFQNTSSPSFHGCSGENHWEISRWEQMESLSQTQAYYTFKCNITMKRQIWPPERDLQHKLAVLQLHNKNTGRNTNYNTTDPWSGKMHWNETSTEKSMSNGVVSLSSHSRLEENSA